jgi:GDP-4-dehydro-6-deoxy-D-mannose reductase
VSAHTRALVTGAGGFVGPYVVAELLRGGWHVWTLDRSGTHHLEGAHAIRGDLTDRSAVEHALQSARPDVVLHLAAQSSVPASFRDPLPTLSNNLLGAANLLYAAASLRPMPRVLVVGSAEEYGRVAPEQLPIDEAQPLAPVSPYGVSKAAQSLLALSLHASHDLPAIVLRPFNHTGPAQRPAFAVSSFAEQIARIEAGLQPPVLRVGNLESRRDFTDVRDIARAYALAAARAVPGEVYNLGSGRAVSMRWILDRLLERSTAEVRVETDPARMSPAAVAELCANPAKFRGATGWSPAIPLERTLNDVLDYWRAETKKEIAEA